MKQGQISKTLAMDGSAGKDQHDASHHRAQSSAPYPGGAFNSYHKDSDARSATLIPDALGNRPPILAAANKT